MAYLVGTLEDRFSLGKAHFVVIYCIYYIGWIDQKLFLSTACKHVEEQIQYGLYKQISLSDTG